MAGCFTAYGQDGNEHPHATPVLLVAPCDSTRRRFSSRPTGPEQSRTFIGGIGMVGRKVRPRRLVGWICPSGTRMPKHGPVNSFFWFAVVLIFKSSYERRMYSWVAALIHHMA